MSPLIAFHNTLDGGKMRVAGKALASTVAVMAATASYALGSGIGATGSLPIASAASQTTVAATAPARTASVRDYALLTSPMPTGSNQGKVVFNSSSARFTGTLCDHQGSGYTRATFRVYARKSSGNNVTYRKTSRSTKTCRGYNLVLDVPRGFNYASVIIESLNAKGKSVGDGRILLQR